MNRQEIFNKVAAHLLTQGRKAQRGANVVGDTPTQCRYRGENGTMCAVGCLISDDVYTPELEGAPVRRASVLGALKSSGVSVYGDAIMFLARLQTIHDTCEVHTWRDELEIVATQYDLEWKH